MSFAQERVQLAMRRRGRCRSSCVHVVIFRRGCGSAGDTAPFRRMIEFALALYLLFLLVTFGWRAWVQYRRTGDHGFRIFSGRLTAAERIAGALFALSLVALLGAPVAALLGLLPTRPLEAWVSAPAAALAIAGFAVTVLAQLDMGTSWRVGVDPSERTEFVTQGLFRFVRNPIFSGLGLFAIGLALLVPNLLSALALLSGLVGLELQVRRVEEPFLLRAHGEDYRAYAREVGRFVPRVGRLRGAGRRPD
jgi:protein-S-isoprenylcysteine O-methyltransferase Ste14